jgi:hypothetical protein
MRNICRFLGLFLLGSTLVLPAMSPSGNLWAAVSRVTDDRPQRYYDKSYKDWHEWNERETRAYRHWMQERRQNYREFGKLRSAQQRDYWRWRHGHPEDYR